MKADKRERRLRRSRTPVTAKNPMGGTRVVKYYKNKKNHGHISPSQKVKTKRTAKLRKAQAKIAEQVKPALAMT